MERREDEAVREVMDGLLRSDLRLHTPDSGISGAMTARGLKDTSSRPAKDLGGTLRRTLRTALRSYDSRASGDLLCPRRQGAWQIWRDNNEIRAAAPGGILDFSMASVRLFIWDKRSLKNLHGKENNRSQNVKDVV